MDSIQKQSIRSAVFISAGFLLGAVNILVLGAKLLSPAQFGLTRLITDLAITMATLCTLGSLPVIYKFFPFYKAHLPPEKNELPSITGMVCLGGFVIMCIIGYLGRGLIIQKFASKSPLFVQYSYMIYPFALFYLAFLWMEGFAWSFKKGPLSNALRELGPRVLFAVAVILLILQVISFSTFIVLFAFSYLLPAAILFTKLRQTGGFRFTTSTSRLTHRLKKKMINFGLFVFGAQFLNLVSKTIDTVIISSVSKGGLADAAVFTLATYVVTTMEIPQRSITAVTIPVLSEAWRNKNLNSIRNIYRKSVANLLVIGLAMFCLLLLNVHNLAVFLGKNYAGIETTVFFLGISKLIDLGTGANTQIISTSNFWKADFITNVIYTIVALPLNYILISKYGFNGAAYSMLIAMVFYNAMRFGFLWYKFKLQPYTWKELLAAAYAAIAWFVTHLVPRLDHIIAHHTIAGIVMDTVVRTLIFCAIFFPAVYYTGVSQEVNAMIKKYVLKLQTALRLR